MTPERINEHIDSRILTQLSEGIKLDEVILYLDDKIKRFCKKKDFIRVTKRYMINNWSSIDIRKRYTTYLTMQSYKRKKQIEWVLSKKSELKGLNDKALFNLIKLKEKLK